MPRDVTSFPQARYEAAFNINFIVRPPDIVLDFGFTSILSSIFFRQLPSKLAERNSTKTGHVLGSECDLKMYVQNLGYTLP